MAEKWNANILASLDCGLARRRGPACGGGAESALLQGETHAPRPGRSAAI